MKKYHNLSETIVLLVAGFVFIFFANGLFAQNKSEFNKSKEIINDLPAKSRVIGMAGVLDSARFRAFIAEELSEDVNNVEAMMLGSHGDLMVPLVGHCKVNGKLVTELIEKEKLDEIIERARKGGGEIVQLLKTGSAFFAPGLSAAQMAESIIKDEKKILPCAAFCEGEYGINGLFVGVPAKLGKDGVDEIVELELSEEEKKALEASVRHIKEVVEKVKID